MAVPNPPGLARRLRGPGSVRGRPNSCMVPRLSKFSRGSPSFLRVLRGPPEVPHFPGFRRFSKSSPGVSRGVQIPAWVPDFPGLLPSPQASQVFPGAVFKSSLVCSGSHQFPGALLSRNFPGVTRKPSRVQDFPGFPEARPEFFRGS